MDQDHVKHCWKHGSKLSLRWIFGCNYRTLRRHFWLSTYQTGDRLHSKKRWWSWITSIPQFPNQLEKELFMRKSAWSRMKSHWHLCVKKSSHLTQSLPQGSWSWLVLVPKKSFMDSHLWPVENHLRWFSTSLCQDFHQIIHPTSSMTMHVKARSSD